MDTVVLACTHFPLLKSNFQSLTERHINWIDSGTAVANRVWQQISENRLAPNSQSLALSLKVKLEARHSKYRDQTMRGVQNLFSIPVEFI